MMLAAIERYKLIFWDFDGVIKDSVAVKTQVFVKLFEPFGFYVAESVKSHHEANGGMSRYDKIPYYLRLAGEEPTEDRVNDLCDRFGKMVLQGVVDSPWVAGAEIYLRTNPYQQTFVLVSATPQEELEQILLMLDLRACFKAVFGVPTSKKEAIHMTLNNYNLASHDCLMIGDARADLEAAHANKIPFLLRRHATNISVFQHYCGASVADFSAFLTIGR